MGMFLLPLEVMIDFKILVLNFLWNSKPTETKSIQRITWSHMSRHTSTEGLGFHILRSIWVAKVVVLAGAKWMRNR